MQPIELVPPGRAPGMRLRIMYRLTKKSADATPSVPRCPEEAPSQPAQLAISAILVSCWWTAYHLIALVGAP